MLHKIDEAFQKANAGLREIYNLTDTPENCASIEKILQSRSKSIFAHKDELKQVFEMWGDEASKQQYLNYLVCCLLKKFDFEKALKYDTNIPQGHLQNIANNIHEVLKQNGLTLPNLITPKHYTSELSVEIICTFGLQQYIYPGQMDVTKDDVFLDCGSFIGDTVLWALQKGAQVYAFEPVKENLEVLKENLKANGYSTQHCYNVGVSDKNKTVTFKLPKDKYNGAFIHHTEDAPEDLTPFQRSSLCADDTITRKVVCISLSDWCNAANVQASYIKMDIEGAELEALHGAQDQILNNKPKLAICLYHRDEDLWTIPLYVKSLVPEYRLFCRENRYGGEFVMYATV